jgi:hypothetical protein
VNGLNPYHKITVCFGQRRLFMFEIPQPSMALNSYNVPPPDYQMWNTRKVAKDVRATDLLANIASVATTAIDNRLRCIVFNSHGFPGGISMGSGIGRGETPLFTGLQGKVHTIVIVACDVAQIAIPNSWGDGNLFCSEIAQYTNAFVFASTALQSTYAYTIIGLPVNCIDEFEGAIFRWDPNGSSRQVDNGYVQRWMMNMKMGKRPEEWK